MLAPNRQQFLNQGYVILRDVVPPERLDELRESFEVLVERQKEIWARERRPEDPPGGEWETSRQPRLTFNKLVDKTTANTVEFCLHRNTLEVSRDLMGAPEAAITAMLFMCNPVRDHGPANWHRDLTLGHPAPIGGLVTNIRHHGPTYVQWNIPLYDDSVLWVVPGSHLRPNTDQEQQQLAQDLRVPLPGSIPVELSAGDGVAYIMPILHWASNYSSKKRRIIHLGYRAFGGSAFSYVHWRHWDPDFICSLSPESQEKFERFSQLWREEHDIIESIFRAAIARDAETFTKHLVRLHPAEVGRIVCIVLLSKLVYRMLSFKQLDVDHLPPVERADKVRQHWFHSLLFDDLISRFSPQEVNQLADRFRTLDEKLRLPAESPSPGFHHATSIYNCIDMPADFDVEDFIASWAES